MISASKPVTRKVPWWTSKLKKGEQIDFAFHTANDMFNIDTHVNCVNQVI